MARADVVAELVVAGIERDGFAVWRARGRSMLGAIRDGERVRLVAPRTIRRGLVVMAALPDGRLVLHRVEKVDEQGVWLRGDSCRRGDGVVDNGSVVAVADPNPRRTARVWLYRLLFG